MKKSIVMMAAALAFGAASAFADQCAYVTEAQAQSAVKLIQHSQRLQGGIVELCQPCGDRVPSGVRVAQLDIGVTGDREVPAKVSVNGESIDLAYTYVYVAPKVLVNLSKLVGCPSHDVSQWLNETMPGRYRPSAKY